MCAITWVCTPIVAVAQNILPDTSEPVPCVTNTGLAGVVFDGHFNTIKAPTNFHSIAISDSNGASYKDRTISDGSTVIYADIRLGEDVLVWSDDQDNNSEASIIKFIDADSEVIETCFITGVDFDPKRHDGSNFSLGYCRFNQTSGVSRVSKGATLIFQLPEKYREGATSPESVLEHQVLPGARQVQLIGNATGFATFVWLGENRGSGALKGLCPVLVTDLQ